MNSPKKVLYNVKKSARYIEHSLHSSGIQTDSTSRISRSALKNITKLKISMKQRKYSKDNRNKNNKNFKLSKYLIYNNNFISSFRNEKSLILPKENILSLIKNNKIKLNKTKNDINYNNKLNIKKHQIRSRNKSQNLLYKNYYSNDFAKSQENKEYIQEAYLSGLKINEPFYHYYFPSNKSILNFKNDSINVRYLKINSYNGKKSINRLQDNILLNNAETEYLEASNRKKNDLLNVYNNALSQYFSSLQRQRNDLTIINYNLSNKKMIINHDILSLKAKTSKLLTKFEKYIDIKFFLICVKEGKLDYKKFSKEKQMDILSDLYHWFINKKALNNDDLEDIIIEEHDYENADMIYFYYFLNKRSQKIKSDFDAHKKTMFLSYIIITLDMTHFKETYANLKHNINAQKLKKIDKIFNSPDEFEKRINSFTSRNQTLLMDFNLLNVQLLNLRNEKQKEIKRIEQEVKYVNSRKIQEKVIEDKLNIIRIKYENNLKEFKYKKNYKEKENNKNIIKAINKILNNLMNYDSETIKNIIKNVKYKEMTLFIKILIIENLLNYLLKYINEAKIKRPNDYDKTMKEIKIEQNIIRFRNREELMKKLNDLKIEKIIEKNNKILFLSHRKNDMKNFYNNTYK